MSEHEEAMAGVTRPDEPDLPGYGASPDAVSALSSYLVREWGESRRMSVVGRSDGSAMARCSASDGSRWWIAADRWGNVIGDADSFAEMIEKMDSVTSEDALFDITPYGGPPKSRPVRKYAAVPEAVEVLGGRWNGFTKDQPGLAHFVVGLKEVHRSLGKVAALVSACGRVVVPHTVDPNQIRPGCAQCRRLRADD